MHPNKKTISKIQFILFLMGILSSSFLLGQTEKETVDIEVEDVRNWLVNAPTSATENTFILVDLPLTNGQIVSFFAVEAPLLSPAMSKQFPDIKTYNVKSVDGEYAGKISITNKGIDGSIFGKGERIMIESTAKGSNTHLVYETVTNIQEIHNKEGDTYKDTGYDERAARHRHTPLEDFHTHVVGEVESLARALPIESNFRTFRLWVIADGEYSEAVDNDGTVNTADVVAAITTAFTSTTAIYERDLGVKLTLAGTTVYTDSNSDIFPNTHTGSGKATEALQAFQDLINGGTIDVNDFDVGHVFSGRGSGGSGYLGVVCRGSINTFYGTFSYGKAGGGSGMSTPTGSSWVDLVAHEIGHQFDANHVWSGQEGSCTPGQFNSNASIEPGSGTTLMSYSGSCGNDNVPNAGDGSYFHTFSIEEIDAYITNDSGMICRGLEATNNNAPSINLSNCTNLNIPIGTPFLLTGAATDVNGDGLIYGWEQYDATPVRIDADQHADEVQGPLFRSFTPNASPTRFFPQLSDLAANNYNTNNAGATFAWNGELLPEVARAMKFRFTVKDNAGGIATQQITLNAYGSSSADYFTMSAPNGGESWTAGNSVTVSWNVNGTDGGSINCNNVDILLSIDGGLSFPITLVSGTANDGSHTFTVPSGLVGTTSARVMVACGNDCLKFFDISNSNFTINSSCAAQANNICPTQTIVADAGDAALDLNENNKNVGLNIITSKTLTISGNQGASPADNSGSCGAASFFFRHGHFTFQVSENGNYTFTGNVQGFYTIFETDAYAYNSTNPCGGFTYINASRATNGFGLDNVSGTLEACKTYTLVVGRGGNGNVTVSCSGAGDVFEIAGMAANTAHTFIAINQSNNQVVAQSAGADFTSLPGGGTTYNVYGVSYDNALNPADWVTNNLTQSQLTDGSRCLLLSNNSSTLTVNGSTCTTPTVGNSTNPTTCSGTQGSIQISNLSASTNYTLSYKKDGSTVNGGSVSSNGSGAYTITGLTAGSYTEINFVNGVCSSNLSATLSDPANPTPTLGTVTNPSTCNGSNGSIQLTSLANSTSYSVSYRKDGASPTTTTLSSNGSGQLTITGLAAGNYTEINVTVSNCTSSNLATTLSDPTTPSPSLGTVTNPSTCNGTNGSIQLTGLSNSTSYSVSYRKDGASPTTTTLSSNGSGQLTITGLAAGSYTEIKVTVSNCTSSNLATTLSDPTGSTSAVMSGSATVNSGQSTDLSVAVTGGTGPYTCVYSNGSTNTSTTLNISSGQSGTISVSPTTTTTYSIVSITDANGCVGTGNSGNAVINTVCPAMLTVSTTMNDEDYQATNTVTSDATVAANDTVTFIAGQTIRLVAGFTATAGSDFVAYIGATDCSTLQSTDEASIARTRPAVMWNKEELALKLRPNPASDVVTLEYNLANEILVQLVLFDWTGRQVRNISPQPTINSGKYQQEMSLSDLEGGMYLVVLRTKNQQVTKKLIVVR